MNVLAVNFPRLAVNSPPLAVNFPRTRRQEANKACLVRETYLIYEANNAYQDTDACAGATSKRGGEFTAKEGEFVARGGEFTIRGGEFSY
eukprot:1192439-Prorocentrum_minimum.AAC.2